MGRNTYPEMNKLIRLLVLNDIPFEVLAFPSGGYEDDGLQIFSPSLANYKIDAVCHRGTGGYTKGLIEIQSDLLYEEPVGLPEADFFYPGDSGIRGWLTADEALEYFKKVSRARVAEYLV